MADMAAFIAGTAPAVAPAIALASEAAYGSRPLLRGSVAPVVDSQNAGMGGFAQAVVGMGSMVVGAVAGQRRARRRQAKASRPMTVAMAEAKERVGLGRGDIRFFLDTADEKEWDRLLSLGIFYGVTSNPAIMQRCNQPCTIENITRMAKKALKYPNMHTILFQAWGETADNMVKIGEKIMSIDPARVGVKLPLTNAGIEAAARLKAKGAIICMTACMSAKQALIANAVGADYISPYLGKMDEAGMEGLDEITRMHQALAGSPGRTRIFSASFRNVQQLMELACRGMDAFTFGPAVADQLLKCDATYDFVAMFEHAAKENGARV